MKSYPLIHKIDAFDAVILANGGFPHTDIPLGLLDRAPFVCACDGAVNHYPQADAIVGDGDSVPEDLRDRLIQIDEQEDNDLTKATRGGQRSDKGYALLSVEGYEAHYLSGCHRPARGSYVGEYLADGEVYAGDGG